MREVATERVKRLGVFFTANRAIHYIPLPRLQVLERDRTRMTSTDEVIIYIALPATARGRWRVKSDGNPEREVETEEAAVAFAAEHARMIEKAGGVAIVRIERADGTWETFRA